MATTGTGCASLATNHSCARCGNPIQRRWTRLPIPLKDMTAEQRRQYNKEKRQAHESRRKQLVQAGKELQRLQATQQSDERPLSGAA